MLRSQLGTMANAAVQFLTASSLLDPFLLAETSEGRQPQDLADTGAVAADQKRQDYSTRHSA